MLRTSIFENQIELENQSLGALRSSISGAVFLPEDLGYDQARLAWNRKVEQHPRFIVAAKSAQDVVLAVTFARQHGLGVAVQATGHGNVRPADDCLLILTQEMDSVEIDPDRRTACIGAGTQWGKVLAAAQNHGLAPLLGSSPTVGAVGYTLGGGLGWLGRKYGLSLDNVLQFEVVTADGLLRTVSSLEHPDLFWGLRGGGGSLGIVVRMTIRLFPVSQVYAGNLYYPASIAKQVFSRYRDWIANAPDELTTSVLVMNFPPIPEIPEFLRGQSFAIVRGCYCGNLAKGESLLHYWRDWQAPLIDDFKLIPFSDAAMISNDPADPMPAFNTGAWLRQMSDTAIEAIVDFATGVDGPSPLTFAEVRHAGGAIQRVSSDSAAYGNRQAELILSVVGMDWSDTVHQQLVRYTDKMMETLRPDLTGGVYMNFLSGDESRQRLHDGLVAGGYERLARLKEEYDPENIFRFSFNVVLEDAFRGKAQ